jgi:hypothetical protein
MRRGAFNEVSNKASYVTTIVFTDDDTDEPIDLSTFDDIVVTIASEAEPGAGNQLYGYDNAYLTMSKENGDIVVAVDNLSCVLTIGTSQMRSLPAQTYDIGCRLIRYDDDRAFQAVIGKLPVVEGL